ncbi:hypothetical protein JCM14469_31760 [Desulfatiferula olefinivorans]
MKLTMWMYGFYLLFRYTAWKQAAFRTRLAEKDLVLVMDAKDGAVARTFRFEAGRVRSRRGNHPSPQCRLTWATTDDGARVMADIAKGKPKALMTAVIEKRLLLEGDAAAVAWYMGAVNMLGKTYIKKKPRPEPGQ